jgi:uncharacterized protein YbjT (DUF2867 family)
LRCNAQQSEINLQLIVGTQSRRLEAVKVVLTGATGFIGSHILTELLGHGHEVTALVRDDPELVAARGAIPTVVDLYDRPAVVSLLGDADAAIHTTSPGDETSANRTVSA